MSNDHALAIGERAHEPAIRRLAPNFSADSRVERIPPVPVSCVGLVTAAAFYVGLCAYLLHAEAGLTGQITYPLDDPYITMAMAKNLALHGVWGLSAFGFSPASSCPGFLLILAAAYRLTGPTVWWPLALSFAFGLLTLFAAWRLLRNVKAVIQIPALVAIVAFTPLFVLGLLGMEHSLHLALIILFLDLASTPIAERRPLPWAVLFLTAAMVSVRYESLFVVAIAGLLLLANRQIRAAVSLGVAAAIPVVTYAVASVLHGGYWLPNSVALKGTSTHSPIALLHHFEDCLSRAPYMGALIAAMLAVLAAPTIRTDKRSRAMLDMVLGATIIHLFLADVGWCYRYEAYLIAASIVVISFGLRHMSISRDRWAIAALVIFAFTATYLLSTRAVAAFRTLPERSSAVYFQQVQMARFLHQFEEGASVAANDVGAINYYADIKCLDLVGLGDRDVFRLKRQNNFNKQTLSALAVSRGVQIAIVYDSWFPPVPRSPYIGPPLPSSWIRVARWRTPYGYYLGSNIVSFYAADPSTAAKLEHDLALFAPSLPKGVEAIKGNQFFARPGSTAASTF